MGHSSLLQFIHRLGATGIPCSLSDAELLKRYIQDEDKEAFGLLVRRHGSTVWNVCRRVLVREQDAEDAFQATFAVLAKKAAAIAQRELLGAWLFGVARRLALKARAGSKSLVALEGEDQAAVYADPLAAISARELLGIVDEELAALPEVYRAPLILCCLEGKTRDEAAQLLHWSAGSLKGRLERARQLLERRLTRRGIALSAAMAALTASTALANAAPAALGSATVKASLTAMVLPPGAAILAAYACRLLLWESMRKWVFAAAMICLIGIGARLGSLIYPRARGPSEIAPPVIVRSAIAPMEEPAREERVGEQHLFQKEPPVLAKVDTITMEGTLRKVDAGARTITVATGGDAVEGGGQLFHLAPGVEISTPTGAAQLADLTRTRNPQVQLRLTADRREVVNIMLVPRIKGPAGKGKG